MNHLEHDHFDQWILAETPESGVVLASRARVARNLRTQPFTMHANAEQLRHIEQCVAESVQRTTALSRFESYEMEALTPADRCFLRESYLISPDLEKGGSHRMVYLAPQNDASLMVNEEDHLRLAVLGAGFQIQQAYDRLSAWESDLETKLPLAFSEDFGYLTACPTNTGTGLRVSIMMHLPALSLLDQVEITLADLGSYGLVVRGAYGENSENTGDLYQISNELTLGKTEQELMDILTTVARQIVEREIDAREQLMGEWRSKLEDMVCRAMGVLANARRIDTKEAIDLLSRIRLGIGQDWGVPLTHPRLSRLFVQIQPAHLQDPRQPAMTPLDRDEERAKLLRSIFGGRTTGGNNN